MKSEIKISFFFLIISMNINAQDANYGIGESNIFVQPVPSQGNSAGMDFNLPNGNFVADLTKEYKVSFDSELNEVNVEEMEFVEQTFSPLRTGTEYIEINELNNSENPNPLLADFYYSVVCEARVYGYGWYLNYDWTNFQERLTTLGNQGYRIENIDTYGRNIFNYAGTWTQDGKGWAWVLNYTSLNDFVNVLNNWPNSSPRYRPIDFSISPSGSQLYYGAVAIADNLAFNWIFNENNSNTFITWINNQYNSGLRLVEIQLYRNTSGTFMCGGISKPGSFAQQVAFNINYNEFINLNNQYNNSGYRLVDFDQYYVNGQLLFGGLWNNDGIGGAWTLNEHNVTTFQNTINNFIGNGFKPMVLDVYDADWAVSVSDNSVPYGFALEQNYPNPFNPSTTIKFSIPEKMNVTLKIFDLLGIEITTLINEELEAASYQTKFNADNLSSGIYFYQLSCPNFIINKKMLLIK